MIKKIAWNTFKNTGDVNTFLELKQIQNIEEQIQSQKQNRNWTNMAISESELNCMSKRWSKMGTVKTSGIIISENNLGDYDKMLTMLTPGLGKISCVAKGARRPRSALLAGTQFCALENT